MMLPTDIQEAALKQAKEEFPRESCGLIVVIKGKRRYFACKNIAETPYEHFVLDPKDYVEAQDKGEIVAVVHSHPKTNHAPSQADKVACEKTGLPWHVVNPKTELWGYCEPSGYELPYVGREFMHGLVDCYALLKDWYKGELNIELRDYERRDEWWHKGQNLYLDNFKREGFYEIPEEEMSFGDVLLMHIESPVPNHAAIFLGDNLVLHHVQGRLSSRDVYGGYYQKATAKVLHHENR